MHEKLRGVLECVNKDFCKINQRNPKWQVLQLCLLTLPKVPTKDSRQTNSPFAPFYFCGGKAPGLLTGSQTPLLSKKPNSLPGVQHTSDCTLRETLVFASGLYKPGCSQVLHKSSTQTIKTFQYLCILANKGISVHWLQVTQFSYQLAFCLLLVNHSLASNADQSICSVFPLFWVGGPRVSGHGRSLPGLPFTQLELIPAQLLSWLYWFLPYLVGSAECPCGL